MIRMPRYVAAILARCADRQITFVGEQDDDDSDEEVTNKIQSVDEEETEGSSAPAHPTESPEAKGSDA